MCRKLFFLTIFVLVLALASANTVFGAIVIETSTNVANNDGEDHIAYAGSADDGAESRGSSDLEMPWEDSLKSGSLQVIGLRFVDIQITKGSKIKNAYVQFTADSEKTTGGPVNLIINGLLQPDTVELSSGENFYTDRNPKTTAEVAWTNIPDWTSGQATLASRTVDISSIIQEIIDQDDWVPGNSLMVFFRDNETNPSADQRSALANGEGPDSDPLLHIELSSKQATEPDPADGSLYEATWASLAWAAGDTAVSHDVYMGDNFADVNDGTGETFRGNQVDTFLLAGFYPYPFPDGLVPGTTYYWRIDEVENDGATKHKGFIWSFSVPSKTAYKPVPSDGGKYVAPDATLSWAAGFGAKVHYVYFGTSFDEVNNAAGASPQAPASYNPGPLADNTTYYWRVDEFDGPSTHTGNVWSFRTRPAITITDPDLIGWWKFDEGSGTPLDWSGHENHATLGRNPEWTEGIMGGALNLSGDDYVAIDGVVDDITSTDITISAWIKTTQTDEGELFATNDGASAHPFMFGIDNGSPYVNDGSDVQFSAVINDDQWHMLTYVRDGSRGYIYVDAVQVGTYNSAFSLDTVTRWSIGQEWDGSTPSDFYTGMVDDVRFYNKALSQAEVVQLTRGDLLAAWNPSPGNNATVDVEGAKLPLTWSPGDQASQHDVYFGTDPVAVEMADSSDTSGVYRGRKAGTSYSPTESLDWGTGPYYWRVDEINADATITMGGIWNFTVADHLIVEDFESYDAEDNQLWFSWHDGLGYGAPGVPPYFAGNGTGAAVGDENTMSYTEQSIVHGGGQSMPISYNNNKTGFARYSETELKLTAPRDWTKYDVAELSIWFRGYPASVGSFVEGPTGTYTITGSGADIWYQADEFHFAYKMLTGAGSIVAKVVSLDNTNDWAKAGVMIRESLEPNSKYAFAVISPVSGAALQYRLTSDTDAAGFTQAGIAAPYWLKLERSISGSFSASVSTNGSTWVAVENSTPQIISMASTVYVGLAVSSHDVTLACTAKFSNVQIVGNVGTQWANQDIGITTNAAEPLYVAVSNATGSGAVVVHDNPAASQIDTWTEWVIPLQAFADQGINMANVDRIAIGLGNRGNMSLPGGAGKMFIDDIGLYQIRIAPEPDPVP